MEVWELEVEQQEEEEILMVEEGMVRDFTKGWVRRVDIIEVEEANASAAAIEWKRRINIAASLSLCRREVIHRLLLRFNSQLGTTFGQNTSAVYPSSK